MMRSRFSTPAVVAALALCLLVWEAPLWAVGAPEDYRPTAEKLAVVCTDVISADRITVETRQGGHEMKVLYLGVLLPDPKDPDPDLRSINHQAVTKNREWVTEKSLSLELERLEPNAQGYFEAYVFVGSIFVNGELVRQGLADIADTTPEFQLHRFFARQRAKAQEEQLGMWAPDEPTPTPIIVIAPFLASKSSKYFHSKDCEWAGKIADQFLVEFPHRAAALSTGKRPCHTCNP